MSSDNASNNEYDALTPDWPIQDQKYVLREAKFLSRNFLILLIISFSVLFSIVVPDIVDFGFRRENAVWLMSILGIISLTILYKLWTRPRDQHVIILARDHVLLPRSRSNKKIYRVNYEDIRALFRIQQRRGELVLIDTPGRLLTYSEADFSTPAGPASLWANVLTRIRALPDGADRLAQLRQLTQTAYDMGQRPLPLTRSILAFIAIIFAIQLYTNALGHPFRLVELGANAPSLLAEGQIFRLFTANFLHGGWLHLILNGVALFFLGTVLERLLGSWKLGVIFLLSALGGAFASSMVAQGPLSVGTSTAIFGLLGAFGSVHLKFSRHLPPPFRQTTRWWIFILGINSALPIIVPQIDVAAHIGGFIVGALITLVFLRHQKNISQIALNPAPLTKIFATIIGLVFLAAFIQAGRYKLNAPHTEDLAKIVNDYEMRGVDDRGEMLNALAWMIVIDETSTMAELQLAERAVTAARNIYGDFIPEYTDTLATTYYRQGKTDKAIQTQHEIFRHQTTAINPIFLSQFARFLYHHYRQTDTYYAPQATNFVGHLSSQTTSSDNEPSTYFSLLSDIPNTGLAELHFVAHRDNDIIGLISICLGPEYLGQAQYSAHDLLWPGDSDYALAYVDTQSTGCAATHADWHFHTMLEEIRNLP